MSQPSKPFDMKAFFKKQWSNILFFAVVLLFIIPSSRIVIQSKMASIFSTSPNIIATEEREQMSSYNLVLKDLYEQTVNLKQSEGRPILINFWATWCAPCLAELPDLNKLHKRFKNEVDFYFVSQESEKMLNKFIKSKNYNLPIYIQQTQLPKPLNNEALPSTYLIHPNGKIIAKATGAAKWNDKNIHEIIESML